MRNLLLLLLGLAIVAFILWQRGLFNPNKPVESVKEVGQKAVQTFTGGNDFNVTPDTPGYENYLKLRQGCPVKDCIPSIDNPIFESASDADEWLKPEDVVFAINYKGEQRAYPQRILNWHEIVNDEISGDPLAITFCPLCGSSLTFDRRLEGRTLTFGVSGKLHNSDLVMYDRETESLWQQIIGEAIVGEHFGKKLTPVPMDTLRWSEWKAEHPDTRVLSRDTGYSRNYDRYPYGSYENDTSVFFPVEDGVDQTIHPKDIVFGLEVNEQSKAYTKDYLEAQGEIIDSLGGQTISLTYNNGQVTVKNITTGETLSPVRLFWFAWKAFHPDTLLHR